jgi:gluconolactonase
MTVLSIKQATPELERLIDPAAELRRVASGFVFIEGPAWHAASSTLLFSDIQNDTRWRWTADGGAVVDMRPSYISNGMVFDGDGGLLVCEHVTSSVVRLLPDGNRQVVAYHHEGRYLNSPNDVVSRSDGSVYFTDPNYGRWNAPCGVERRCDLDFQGLFRVPAGGGPLQLLAPPGEFSQPNGLCFSPDESVLYVDDVQGIKAFDVAADGSLGPARILHWDMGLDGRGLPGEPDGMKCDEFGNVWCCARGGVWVISPAGDLLGIIETPEITANIAWGGPGWRTLFLCSSTSLYTLPTRARSAPLPYH